MCAGGKLTCRLLAHKSAVHGLSFYVLAGILASVLAAGGILAVICFLRSRRRRRRHRRREHQVKNVSISSPVSSPVEKIELGFAKPEAEKAVEESRKVSSAVLSSLETSPSLTSSEASTSGTVKLANIGWGRWFSLAELQAATGGFREQNVVGQGGYGVVYKGVLPDFSVVAVKNLLNNKGQAEREFKVEVEAIGKVKHKNLVGLVGYCAEGPERMLVYKYVDNGTLEQWLHGDVGPVSPLTWDIRMKIAIGTAKGIAYLHEGLEPKVVHRDVKSSNILLDKQWNPKVSDFGLAKLLGSDLSYVTTRVMGTFGYVAPEYASTGMLNEGSDIYSFGVLLMEIISGRNPVDHNRSVGEVNLVDWFKGMVGSRRVEELIDPLIEVKPSPRDLKRVVLVCLRCVDSDALKRPKMGQIVHMLEGNEFPFRTEHKFPRESAVDDSRDTSPATPHRIFALAKNVGSVGSERSMWR